MDLLYNWDVGWRSCFFFCVMLPTRYCQSCLDVAVPHLVLHKNLFMHSFLASNLTMGEKLFQMCECIRIQTLLLPDIKAQICLRCFDRCLILESRRPNTCCRTQTEELCARGKVFQEPTKRVSLAGNQFVSTIVPLLWLRFIPGWVMGHCWHFPCCRLLLVARNTELL